MNQSKFPPGYPAAVFPPLRLKTIPALLLRSTGSRHGEANLRRMVQYIPGNALGYLYSLSTTSRPRGESPNMKQDHNLLSPACSIPNWARLESIGRGSSKEACATSCVGKPSSR